MGSGRALLLTTLLSGVGCGASTTARTSRDAPSADGIDAADAPTVNDASVDAPSDPPRDGSIDARADASAEDRGDGTDAPSDLSDRDAPDAPPADTHPVDGGGVVLCAADGECDDGIACTTDACLTGVCAHFPRNEDCAAGELCDLRRGCVLGAPCATNADCLDDDPCTHEFCSLTYGRCRYYLSDDDADDHVSVACGGGDCDDARRDVHPGVSEVCNGRDDDCDGQVDENPTGALCGAGGVCPSGACECVASGTTLCDGRCVDPSTDAAHCGGCGLRCRPDQVCAEGRCACATGITECGGACVDLSRDVSNCGACGDACPRPYGEGCQSWRCACAEGRTLCGSGASATCADTTSDATHCGACGNACPPDATCASRRCVCRTPGQTVCGGRCVATERDSRTAARAAPCARPPPRALALCDVGACRWSARRGAATATATRRTGARPTPRATRTTAASRAALPGGATCARRVPGEVWARSVGRAGTSASIAKAVATDARGNVFAVGDIALGATVGADALTGTGSSFIASFDPTGALRWGQALSRGATIHADDVAVDAASNVYVVGWFSGTPDFGGGAVVSSGNHGFVASYSGAGEFRWARRLEPFARGLAADPSGNLVVVGSFSGTVDFGGGPLTATSYDGYALALTSSGDFRWVTQLRGARRVVARRGLDASGEVTVVGRSRARRRSTTSRWSTGGQDGIAIRPSTTGGAVGATLRRVRRRRGVRRRGRRQRRRARQGCFEHVPVRDHALQRSGTETVSSPRSTGRARRGSVGSAARARTTRTRSPSTPRATSRSSRFEQTLTSVASR
ncbi:MAG: MopE-related protein [Polyangiales bacterium]